MLKAALCFAAALMLAAAPVKADEFEADKTLHGPWYSCIYTSGQDVSARLGIKGENADSALVIDLYSDGKDPIGIRLYSPLQESMPPLDGRTNHGSIDVDGRPWSSATYAVYALSASECAYAYPDKDIFEGFRNGKECTFHIINEFGVKRSFTFSLDGFAAASQRAAALRNSLKK